MNRTLRIIVAAALFAVALALPAAAELKVGAATMTSSTGLTVTPPVGAVISWYKSLKGVPQALPEGWAEVNGQVVEDAASPLYKTQLPDLNRVSRTLLQGASATVARAEEIRADAAAKRAAVGKGEEGEAAKSDTQKPPKSAKDAGPNPFDVIFIMRIK